MVEPKNLEELDQTMKLHAQLFAETDSKEKIFPVLKAQFEILGMCMVQLYVL